MHGPSRGALSGRPLRGYVSPREYTFARRCLRRWGFRRRFLRRPGRCSCLHYVALDCRFTFHTIFRFPSWALPGRPSPGNLRPCRARLYSRTPAWPGVHGARCGAARCAKDRLITVRSCRHEPASSSWRRWEQRRLFAGRGASHCCLRCSGPAQRAPSSSWAASGASTSWWAECCCGSAPRCRRRS
jgi:hypothetical protein